MARQAIRLVIRGRVQGVGYRWWAKGQATSLGLDGWVRNRGDGTVELLTIGEAEALNRLAAAGAVGPLGAEVRGVDRIEANDDGSIGFTQGRADWR